MKTLLIAMALLRSIHCSATVTELSRNEGGCQGKVLEAYKLMYVKKTIEFTGIRFTGSDEKFESYELTFKELELPGQPVFKLLAISDRVSCAIHDSLVQP